MKSLLTLVLLAVLQVPSGAADRAPITATPVAQSTSKVSPKDSAIPGKKWMSRKFQIKNTSGKDFFVHGQSLDLVFIQILTKDPDTGKWESQGLGYCGTGAGLHRVKVAAAFNVTVSLPTDIAEREFIIEFTRYQDANQNDEGKQTRTQPLSMNPA